MRFHGLFIGVDRYQGANINWLSSAVRDATALHALFTDSFAGDSVLLADDKATNQAIKDELVRLAGVSTDEDVVVIAFSGHGTPTHALVPYDADRARLAETLLPLDELATLLNNIPAATMLCVLDCCFSGGFGAKVLTLPVQARGLTPEEQLLEQMAGKGRVVFTASAADEPAYEDGRLGHGLLTYHLLAALQGQPEVLDAGKIDVYRLLGHVSQQVVVASTALGDAQHPTFRGSVDGVPSWPILAPGPLFLAAFPERNRQPATEQVHSLEQFGLPTQILDVWAQSIPGLNELQLSAINDYGVLDGDNLLVTAPTSSGKTMVGELAALQGVAMRRRAIFLLPMRALVNDKYTEFTNEYADLEITTIRATGEISDDMGDLMAGRYDICLMTYEKFGNLVLANPRLLRQVGTIIVDEVQMMVDPNRGANLEFILTLLKSRRAVGVAPQLICLSAVIGDTGGLEHWLDGRQLLHTQRPVPLVEGVIGSGGQYHFFDENGDEKTEQFISPQLSGKNSSQDFVIPLVRRLVQEGKQVIVFREIKGETIGCAAYLANQLALPAAQEALDALPTEDPSTSSERLRAALAGGVAFHNADLNRIERQVLEEEFRRNDTNLRVLVATTTLAMGVNTPAGAVVIVGLNHPGNTPYKVAEYKNMVGRAGRLGYTPRGEAYIVPSGGLDGNWAWQHYVNGSPEDVESVFLKDSTDPRSLVLRALAALEPTADGSVDAELLISFLESSFGVFQEQRRNPAWRWERSNIMAILSELVRHQLIETVDANYRLTGLGRFAGEGGVHVDSIIRLVEVLRPVTNAPNSSTLIAAAQLTRELDDVYMPFNRIATNTEHPKWAAELRSQQIAPSVLSSLGIGANDGLTHVARAKKAVACLLYASNMPLSDLERNLTQHQREDGGVAGAVRSAADRTRDLIPAVVKVYEFLHPDIPVGPVGERTMTRLELGIPAELADLGKILAGRLSRAQYLNLLANGILTVDDFLQADNAKLSSTLNMSTGQVEQAKERLQAAIEHQAEVSTPLLAVPTE